MNINGKTRKYFYDTPFYRGRILSSIYYYELLTECIITGNWRYSADLVQFRLGSTMHLHISSCGQRMDPEGNLEEEGAQVDDVNFVNDTKLLAGLGVEDTVNIDDNATAATSEIPDNTTNGEHIPLPLVHHSATLPVSVHSHCRMIVYLECLQ